MKSQKFIFFILLLTALYSCKNKGDERLKERWPYYLSTYDSILNEEVFAKVSDTVNSWINKELKYWAFHKAKNKRDWKLSPYIFFNSKQNKCLGYFPVKHLNPKFKHDNIKVIIGEKHKGSWWFYPGPSYHIPREDEKKKIPSFEYLEYRARRIAMGWYYKEERKSFGDCNNFLLEFDFDGYNQCRKLNYTINDAAFERIHWKIDRKDYLENFLKEKYVPDKKQDVI